jgi:hypothetical protein
MPGTSMAIVKELQSLAAFKARETYHKKESAKKTKLVEYMYDAFHGNSEKDIASQAKLLINGHGAYAGLFDPLEAVTDASATNLSSQTRTIKKLITNDSKSLHTVGTNRKEDITLSLLKRKSKKSPVAILHEQDWINPAIFSNAVIDRLWATVAKKIRNRQGAAHEVMMAPRCKVPAVG